MNLLKDEWIPVRPLPKGSPAKISLRSLLCGDEKWEVCLPRDDMELATIQLLVCITQTLFIPKTAAELKQRIAGPLYETEYDTAIIPYNDWFQLDHPKYPFMQVRGVTATEVTPMDKLLAGLNSATNSCFVNESGIGAILCSGCASISLFNQATCAPSFGGGFKASLRGSAPITTLIQGMHLRQTIWLNVLSEDHVLSQLPWFKETALQKPTWMDPVKSGDTIPSQRLGLVRGLFWQPAYVELMPSEKASFCDCCGVLTRQSYIGFKKAKFNYVVNGTWPHPHSPRVTSNKKGEIQEKFAAFTTASPSWTQLSRFVVRQQMSDENAVGQQPAAVVLQARQFSSRLHLLIGGYRNNQASILERRHEVFTLNHGWEGNTTAVHYLVQQGLGYRDALYKALYVFSKGIKDIKGAGIKLNQVAEMQFYRRSEPVVQDTLARIDFNDPAPALACMQVSLKSLAKDLFDESIRPYLQDPELIKTMAVARRTLNKHLRNLEPQKDEGGNNGTPVA
ncbi:MAG: type I-E CRISPR-associated protein Cse1/CasA [Nitrospirae bacterium]|nr:type I-E CRISPR-associated protein Cse1/CasA [Nitrospirota bacterium]MBI5675620.1 type I-E CRISPR-associated protein Cse1/CasA [Nitrospirota bacterium]